MQWATGSPLGPLDAADSWRWLQRWPPGGRRSDWIQWACKQLVVLKMLLLQLSLDCHSMGHSVAPLPWCMACDIQM